MTSVVASGESESSGGFFEDIFVGQPAAFGNGNKLLPIRGAAFEKFAQLVPRRDDVSGSMQIRVLLMVRVACRLAGCLVHDPRIPRVLRLQPLADTARQAADDISHRVLNSSTFALTTVRSNAKACAAISMSFGPIGVPRCSTCALNSA